MNENNFDPFNLSNVKQNKSDENPFKKIKSDILKKRKKRIIIFIIILFVVLIGLLIFINKDKFKSKKNINTKTNINENNNNIDKQLLSNTKISSNAFIDSLELYMLYSISSEYDTSLKDYNLKLPSYTGTVTCIKNSKNNWTGKVGKSATSCDEYLSAAISKFNLVEPENAKLIISKDGKILKGSTLGYNSLICNYNGTKITKCSKN